MKILQVIPTLNVGGAEILCENLSTELVRLGHTVTIVCLFNCSSPIVDRLKDIGIPVCFLGKKTGLDFSMIGKLRKVFSEESPDAIHVHLPILKYVVPALNGKRIPIVYTVHNIASKDCGKFDLLYNKYCFKNKIAIPVGLSEKIKESICTVYNLRSENIRYIYNGVNISNIVKKNNNDDGNFNIICVARFSNQKNHLKMIRCFKNISNNIPFAKLFLAGEGETMNMVKDEIVKLDLSDKIEFLGLVSNVNEILHNYNVFWLTSDYEGMPMTIIEAMAAGLPVVSTSVGGVPDMIENGIDGILTGMDEKEISESMVALFNNIQLKKKISENAVKKAYQFSITKTAEEYLNLYSINSV